MRRANWPWIPRPAMHSAGAYLPFGAILLLGAFTLFGCGSGDVNFGGVKRDKNYNSLVSLSPSTTELLSQFQLASNGRLKGRTEYDDYPQYALTRIPIVASVKPDYEKIAQIHPDMVLYDGSLYKGEDVEKIKQLGAETFVVDANTVQDFIKQCYEMTNKLGGETEASDYVDRIVAAEAGAASNVVPTVAVIMPGTGSQHMIAGTGSFVADVVRVSDGKPVGPDGTEFVPLNPELLVSLNPAWIITSGDPTPLLKDPRFQTLDAIKLKHVLPINAGVVLRRGSRVDQLITAIGSKIHK